MNISNELKSIIEHLDKNGAKAIIVGGAVRDYIVGKDIKDWDIEVYNISTLDRLEELLKPFGKVNQVGKSYGIIKLTINKSEFDFSLPRVDTKIDKGHKGFSINILPSLDFKEASKRRDFTINTIGYDYIKDIILDPFNGIKDIKNRVLRVVDKDSFTQDPLRVYRAIGFSARFNLEIDSQSFRLLKSMVKSNSLDELPKERVFIEFKKLLLKSNKPSIGFELMRELGIIEKYFPELNRLISFKQDNIWKATLLALDEMATICKDLSYLSEDEKVILMLAILCHNLGKTTTTDEFTSLELTKLLIEKLTYQKDILKEVLILVEYHLKPFIYFNKKTEDSTIRELSTKVNIKKLLLIARAYSFSKIREDRVAKECKACNWLEKKAKELNVLDSPPKAIIEGKDLIKLGLKPSKEFKDILKDLYKRQLNGEFVTKEEAYNIIRRVYGI